MKYPQAYLIAFERVIGHEGKYQNLYDDRGNWTTGVVGKGERKGTKFGIAAMSYPDLNIKQLTIEQAKEIYYCDFWLKLGGEAFHKAVMYQLFDASINHGSWRAIRFLQRAVGAKDDGYYGKKTEAAVKASDHNDVLLKFLAERLDFMNDIKTWSQFSRGWSQRIAENLRLAAIDN
ncbi:glycosyl hydrolase 108 family protein (plasmid) [Vibrio alfacsensis]|uniref:glycoside hydrolase family 108 protein n=1 Tax=Vibrio alfacsensis TaxID=1074311 RepID=UPI002ADDCF40|nr:glycosyl hydrolase 108 family protein [Vibrio alfacsensis]WQE79431.1 glycosyl hydrolase 108 family protein [Vibrio alfacsensis]